MSQKEGYKMSRKEYTTDLLTYGGYTVEELQRFKHMLTYGISKSYLKDYRELIQAISLAIRKIKKLERKIQELQGLE